MNNILTALSLLNINKNELIILLSLLNLYKKVEDIKDRKIYKIQEFITLTSIEGALIVSSLNTLVTKNVLGRVELGQLDGKNEIVTFFKGQFLKTLPKNINDRFEIIKQAIVRSGYYISDGNILYTLNPNMNTWKYPTWKKIGKKCKEFDKHVDCSLLKEMIKHKDKKTEIDTVIVNDWSPKDALQLFVRLYKIKYKTIYGVNWSQDTLHIKFILKQLEDNMVPSAKLSKFINYSFDINKYEKNPISIFKLRYFIEQYIVKYNKEKESSKYYRDDTGVLKPKGELV